MIQINVVQLVDILMALLVKKLILKIVGNLKMDLLVFNVILVINL